MAVIKTKAGMVCAYEPQAGDTHVWTLIVCPTERYVLTTQGIEAYQAAVDWAISMADVMARPISILPISATEFIAANRTRLENGLAHMTELERGEMRQVVVNRMLAAMRDSNDPALRAQAHEVLNMMKET